MSNVHFLNVKEGDCSWIEHDSGRNTVIDVSNGLVNDLLEKSLFESVSGNFHQKDTPTNPIEYFRKHNMDKMFRFILTHPDMDHMDGLKALFKAFNCTNFWDTPNEKKLDDGQWGNGKYSKDDWAFYQNLRNGKSENIKVLNLFDGAIGEFYNRDDNGSGDGLYILSPTQELVDYANAHDDYNNISYVILYIVQEKKILFSGDAEKEAWDGILERHEDDLINIDVLIAPHHGRKSGGNDEYLDILKPKLTLFGNAKSKNLDYQSWINRGLFKITNNQAGNIVLNIHDSEIRIFVENEKFARQFNNQPVSGVNGYFIGNLSCLSKSGL